MQTKAKSLELHLLSHVNESPASPSAHLQEARLRGGAGTVIQAQEVVNRFPQVFVSLVSYYEELTLMVRTCGYFNLQLQMNINTLYL